MKHGKSAIICAAYRPPNRTDDEYANSLINVITSVQSAHKNVYFLLGGDFNLPDLEWPHRRLVTRTIPARVTDKFCQMQDDLSLEQLVSFPTRGEKTQDLVFMTHPSLVDKCKLLPSIGKTDHDIVLVDLCISPTIAKTQQRKMFMWTNANNNAIRTKIRELTTIIIEMVRKGTTVNELWTIFKETLIRS